MATIPPTPSVEDQPVTLAVIIGAHGVTGEVRLKLFTEELKAYPKLTGAGRGFTVKSLRPGPNGAVARLAEVTDRNAAEALRGTELTVPRSALPPLGEGEYYHADLIGLACVSTDGSDLGRVVLIENFGAGDVIEVERPTGKRFMVPMKPEAVPEWTAERLVIDAAWVEA
jgi:16S rRNA processing protein RimM